MEHGTTFLDVDGEPTPLELSYLARLNPRALVNAAALALGLKVPTAEIPTMVERRELPAPFKLGGRELWTAGAVLDHIEQLTRQSPPRETKRMEKEGQRQGVAEFLKACCQVGLEERTCTDRLYAAYRAWLQAAGCAEGLVRLAFIQEAKRHVPGAAISERLTCADCPTRHRARTLIGIGLSAAGLAAIRDAAAPSLDSPQLEA